LIICGCWVALETAPRSGVLGARALPVHAIQHEPEMVEIPGGTFQQVCVSGIQRETDELPGKTVKVEPFAMCKYTVTFAQWGECYHAKGCSHVTGHSLSP
jgi:formylglycine-generating enzyme required for sulfatase activity